MNKVLRFTASWCLPCKSLARRLESINTQTEIEVIDIDEQDQKVIEYNIRSIPTLVFLKDGKETKRMLGARHSQDELEEWLND